MRNESIDGPCLVKFDEEFAAAQAVPFLRLSNTPHSAFQNPQFLGGRGGALRGRDDRGQGLAQVPQTVGVGHGGVGLVLDVEGVDRDAALGSDAGKDDVKTMGADGLREAEKQADLVMGLDLDRKSVV